MEYLGKAISTAATYVKTNPQTAACAVVSTAGLAVYAAPILVTAPLLATTGFFSGGVGAGTAATVVHSSIGNVAAGSIFATLQSAGAGGAGLAVVNGAVQAGGAVTAAVGSGVVLLGKKWR